MTTDVTAPPVATRRRASAPSGAARRAARSLVRLVVGLIPLVIGLIVWQVEGDPASPYYPPPNLWWTAVRDSWQNGELGPALRETVLIFLVSMVIAAVVGTIFGVVLGASRGADRALDPALQFIRAIPAAAIVPAAVLILGANARMTVVVVVLSVMWPVLLSTRGAMRNVNPLLLDVSETLGLTRRQRIRQVLLPSLFPAILTGVEVMAPLALIVTLLVEILTGDAGLGGLTAVAQSQFFTAAVYGFIVIAGILALMVNAFIGALHHYATRYQQSGR